MFVVKIYTNVNFDSCFVLWKFASVHSDIALQLTQVGIYLNSI